jgi:hypothetical protein
LDPGRDKRLSPQVRLIATPKHVECEANQRLRKKPIAAIRWPGETGKMLFPPDPGQPTAPNAGILRLGRSTFGASRRTAPFRASTPIGAVVCGAIDGSTLELAA